jgi:hypothetical protein
MDSSVVRSLITEETRMGANCEFLAEIDRQVDTRLAIKDSVFFYRIAKDCSLVIERFK